MEESEGQPPWAHLDEVFVETTGAWVNRKAAEEELRESLEGSSALSTRPAIILTEEQAQLQDEIDRFIADPFQGDVFHYDGEAGTGKTVVLANTAQTNEDCLLAALSGKAASILRFKSGMPADTVHSLIYKLIHSRDLENGKRVMEWRRVHSDNHLRNMIFLLDEKSQINQEIKNDILATGARIVASGDPWQLPPVRGAQAFHNPNFTLTQIHRQALESPIIRQAHRVRRGLPYVADSEDFRVVDRMPKDDLAQADMVLVWKNATRIEMTRIIRNVRGFSGKPPQVGEPVMCLKNAKDFNIYNGVTYKLLVPFLPGDNVIHIEMDGESLKVPNVKFEGMPNAVPVGEPVTTDFTMGYCYTVHKAQGSEADNVVLIDEYALQEHAIAWRYTAITRAAKRMTVMRW